MNQLCIIQEYCEINEIKCKLVEDNNNLFESPIDCVLRLSKITEKTKYCTKDHVLSYQIKYNSCALPILEEYCISDIINSLISVTKTYDLKECCVCYEQCRSDVFKCIRCSAITCNVCLIRDKVEKNDKLIDLMYTLKFDIDFIVREVSKLESTCPVCKIKFDYLKVHNERINKNK